MPKSPAEDSGVGGLHAEQREGLVSEMRPAARGTVFLPELRGGPRGRRGKAKMSPLASKPLLTGRGHAACSTRAWHWLL